ncbi:hypothetical protein B0O80DRAFT_528319, partial [Mortierella sp. GBAus27b]
MGVVGLNKLLKKSPHTAAAGTLKEHQVHVDVLSTFYGLLQSQSFNVFTKSLRTTSIEEAEEQPSQQTSRKRVPPPSQLVSSKKRRVSGSGDDSPTEAKLIHNAQALACAGSPSCYLDNSGCRLTDQPPPQGSTSYRHIAHQIADSLFMVDKQNTILHFDGRRSVEKAAEHRRRNEGTFKRLQSIRIDMEKCSKRRRTISRRIYKRVKSVFRPPAECLTQIQVELEATGWTVCRCAFQADTCIGAACQGRGEEDGGIVITKDSDLICYDGVWTVAMPVGPKREMTLFTKRSLLEYLDLPTSQHLLMTGIITSNDYGKGAKYCGIKTNLAFVRQLAFDDPSGDLASCIRSEIERYVEYIQSKKGIVINFDYAFDAFVNCQEHAENEGVASHVQIQREVKDILLSIYQKQSKEETEDRLPSSPLDQQQCSRPLKKRSVEALRRKRKRQRERRKNDPAFKRKRRQRNRKRRRRKSRRKGQQWNSFSSGDMGLHGRYCPQVVQDLSKAPKPKEQQLSKMAVCPPRPKKKLDQPKKEEDAKPKSKTPASPKKRTRSQRTVDSHKELKYLYNATFQTITETAGTIQSCMRRSTSLSDDEIRTVVNYLDRIVHVLNNARILANRALELYLTKTLERRYNTATADRSQTHQLALSEEASDHRKGKGKRDQSDDPLDLVLSKQYGRSIFRNLVTLLVNGAVTGNREPTDASGWKAKAIAQEIYDGLKSAVGVMEPLRGDLDGPLTVVQQCMSHLMADNFRAHFRRLPLVIRQRMKACGFPEDTLPEISGEESYDQTGLKNTAQYDGDDEENDDDDVGEVLTNGYLVKWWHEYCRLPSGNQPVFCPVAGLKDTFLLFSEEGLLNLLWGGTKKSKTHPTRAIMDRWMSKDAAAILVKEDYGSLFHKLFIGDPEQVAAKPGVRQTRYGRRTTKMGLVSEGHPEFQLTHLREHVDQLFTYQYERAKLKASGDLASSSTPLIRPSLPSSKSLKPRYALSNMMRTDGHQLHLTAFDLRRQSSSRFERVPVKNLTDFDRNGVDHEHTVVIGVDPGEKMSASFCALNPTSQKGITNLLVKRNALYGPTLKHRNAMEQLKEVRPTKSLEDSHGRRITVEVPSVTEIQTALSRSPSDSSSASKEEFLKRMWFGFDELRGFYGSRTVKKLDFDHKNAKRAELDLAFTGALRLLGDDIGCH